jgi:DNA-binding protein HU-beta
MTKQDLVESISKSTSIKNKDVRKIMDYTFDTISKALAKGEKVVISGFGTFEIRIRKGRKGVNPRTKQFMNVPTRKSPAFIAGKPLKDTVNQ